MVFDKKSRAGFLSSNEDFLELIAETYQLKNSDVKRFFPTNTCMATDTKLAATRDIVKCFKGVEAETIPIASVLKLHLQRTQLLSTIWLDPNQAENFNPCEHGYKKEGDSYSVNLQDISDPYFAVPQSLLKGCSCKQNCQNKCSCRKDQNRRNCSRVTCKFCQCFDEDRGNL